MPANSAAPFRTSALKAAPNHNLAPLHSNYGVKTTSKVEWSFVVTDSDTPQQPGLTRWPAESGVKLRDRDKCRRKPFLKELIDKAHEHNERLKDANQPPLVDEELIAANLYTGPVHASPPLRHACCLPPVQTSPVPPLPTQLPHTQMFFKYNAVLRGLQSDSDFLKNMMVQLCGPETKWNEYIGSASIYQTANGALSFEQAKSSLNKYTTTLHGINSAIIKLGKLTKATKVPPRAKCCPDPPLFAYCHL